MSEPSTSSTHFISPNQNPNDSNVEMWKNTVQTCDTRQLLEVLETFERDWCVNNSNNSHIALNLGFSKFFKESDLHPQTGLPLNVDIEDISGTKNRNFTILGHLHHRAKSLGILDETCTNPIFDENELTIAHRVNRLIEQIDDAYQIVFRHTRIAERINQPRSETVNPKTDPFSRTLFLLNTMTDVEEANPFQQATLACLQDIFEKGYRRYKGCVCKQITTELGHNTRAWKEVMTIEEYVYHIVQKETRWNLWLAFTNKGTGFKEVINHLTKCKDIQFPDIMKNRHMWSFNNGVFVGKEWDLKLGKYVCNFYPYESSKFACLDKTEVSCKYFNKYFNDYNHLDDWYTIPTPYFQSVLNYQKFSKDVSRWMYVMGGRLCFETNDLDHWQIIPFLKGIARSGKSTLITKVFRKFYEAADVKTLSNNVERKFGLSSICDAFMFIAPEIKGDLQLEQAEFQSIVSGEDVSIAVKNDKAKSFCWNVPGVLGGNEIPSWKDNSGSILRRILPFDFAKQVKDADTQLDNKLEDELPTILQKCVRAYLEFAQKNPDVDIWNLIPDYFKTIQKQVAMSTRSLQHFLESTNINYGPDLFCPQKEFVKMFNEHCMANNLGKHRFTRDFWAGPFSSRDIEVRETSLTYNGHMMRRQPFIFGLNIIQDSNDIEITQNY